MTTYRVLRLPSLADDLEEVLIPTDKESKLRPIPAPPRGRLVLVDFTRTTQRRPR